MRRRHQPFSVLTCAAVPARRKPMIAADREEADAALGAGHRAFGIGAIEAGDLAGLACRPRRSCRARPRRSASADRARAPSVSPIDRSEGPTNSTSMPGIAAIASRLLIAVLVSIIASVTMFVVGLAQIGFRIGDAGERHRPRRPPAAFAERRILRGADEGLGVGDGVDHRRDDAFGAEVEHAARHVRTRRAGCARSVPRRAGRIAAMPARSRPCPTARAAGRW